MSVVSHSQWFSKVADAGEHANVSENMNILFSDDDDQLVCLFADNFGDSIDRKQMKNGLQ